MDIEIKCWVDNDYGNTTHGMKINGKHALTVGGLSECPEDAIIGRDLVDCCQVSQFMAEAHKAGVAGEKLNIIIIEVKEKDECYE